MLIHTSLNIYLKQYKFLQQSQPEDGALDTIHSLMMQTNFVDSENSLFTQLSPKQQKDTLDDMQFDEKEEGTANEESDDAIDQKEIQRGPRFKHFGHDRRGK